MQAMILAAGFGQRMRPLTDHTPKPLLPAGGRPLIEYPIERLRRAGITDILINLAHLGDQIRAHLGDGNTLGVQIDYSEEPFPLETGGAIAAALPWLTRTGAEQPFVLVNGDVWSDFAFEPLLESPLAADCDGRLVMVDNPDFNPDGDFSLQPNAQLARSGPGQRLTYSGMALLRPSLVADYPQCRQQFPLPEAFYYAMQRGRLTGQHYDGDWQDIGTPERLAALDRQLLEL